MTKKSASDRLVSQLRSNIDAISRGLMIAFDVSFDGANIDVGAATSRWLDFRFRYIEPHPREVVFSDRFPKALPEKIERGFLSLVEKIGLGMDVNPYQSKTLTGHRRSPGRSQLRFRTDMLFADWGMSHFHLTDVPVKQGDRFSDRSDWLAFCFVTPEQVAVVDVAPHPDHPGLEFADPDLMRTAIRSWPDSFEHLRIRRISPDPPMTMTEIHALRSNSTNAFFSFGEHAYRSPGGGYMSNKVSAAGYRWVMVLNRDLESLAKCLSDPTEQFLGNADVRTAGSRGFAMKIHEGGIGIYEHTSRVLFRQGADGEDDVFGLRRMSELILPRWAMSRVVEFKDSIFDDLFCGDAVGD